MSEITVTEMGPGEFGVQVREGDTATSHRVQVPESFLDDLLLGDEDQARIVRESFAFLLEREPATSILAEFALPAITGYFPEYPDELRRRLS
ncbi:MAG: hypothetical protein M3Q48_06165 [Actinomycetota bacterium]|nr:hypothetical protein [Actinomycetota bacterium]